VPLEAPLTAGAAASTRVGAAADAGLPSSLPTVVLSNEGVDRRLKEAAGHVLLVHIWATWCAPCLSELPAFDRIAQKAEARGVRVLALAVDTDDRDIARVPDVLRARAPHLSPTVADFTGKREFFALFSKTWRGTIPATFVFAPDGRVHREFPNAADPQKVSAALDELLSH
jgi:thiol-disulfide isomerase/thioredoxin